MESIKVTVARGKSGPLPQTKAGAEKVLSKTKKITITLETKMTMSLIAGGCL